MKLQKKILKSFGSGSMTNIEHKEMIYSQVKNIDEYSSLARLIISLSDVCNYRCSFCPHGNGYEHKTKFISLETIRKIKDSLKGKFRGSFSLSGFGEPTLNPNMNMIISELKQIGEVVLYSNGWAPDIVLNSGADKIEISAYDEETANYFESLKNDNIFVKRFFTKGQTFFNNRAGFLKSNLTIPDTCCNIIMMKMSIDTDGNMLQCCSDWSRKNILGNVYRDNIWDVWKNKMRHERELLLSGNRKNTILCSKCTSPGDLYGNQYKEFWKDYYAKHK